MDRVTECVEGLNKARDITTVTRREISQRLHLQEPVKQTTPTTISQATEGGNQEAQVGNTCRNKEAKKSLYALTTAIQSGLISKFPTAGKSE